MDNELNNIDNEVTVDTEVETEVEGKQPKGKTYTEDELQELLQKEGDRRITQYQKTLEKKQREAERLRSMNEEDKRNYELQQRELAIEAKEKQLATLENKAAGLSVLADKGLDATLIDFILDEDADVMYQKINTLDKAFKKSVKAEVESRLASKTPKKALEGIKTYTTKDIANLPMAELTQLMQEQPELFSK